eukprot:5969028-Pyramimonas_sp.AAC.1
MPKKSGRLGGKSPGGKLPEWATFDSDKTKVRPIRRRKRGYILMTNQSDAGSTPTRPPASRALRHDALRAVKRSKIERSGSLLVLIYDL